MIGKFKGILVEKNLPQAVIDVNDMGYEVDTSMQTFCRLSATGGAVQLYVQFVVREDAHLLFGFATAGERATSRQLVRVSDIGAKTTLGILSAMSADELVQAVAEEDVKRPFSVPDIDEKTIEHIVLELRGKLVLVISGGPAALSAVTDGADNIVSILLTLGYNEREVRATVRGLPKDTDVGEGVRLTLKSLLK